MISMRYGTIPIVRDTGGLHDTVKNYNVKCQMSNVKCSCTGFVFKEYSAKALQREIKRAVKVYLNSPKTFQQMQKNSLTKDFSWNKSAKKYIGLYKTLLK
jgi:starch synthase